MSESRDETTIDSITQEFVSVFRSGHWTDLTDFISRYPQHQAELREVLPTVLAMERARLKKHRQRSDGKIALGPEVIEQLGDFTIVREIGRGGMGIVYEAIQDSLQRSVALKLLPNKLLSSKSLDEKRRQQFEREARLAAGLHHTNIVPIYGVGQHSGYQYYVMQLIEGISLNDMAKLPTDENGRLAYRQVADIGRQVASAMAYAHENSILHRDIKPANLIRDGKGTVWVTDFGLAANLLQEDKTEEIAGTLQYLPPESLGGTYDIRSEVYCLGVTLLELLHGKSPFGTGNLEDLKRRIRIGDHDGIKHEKNAIPADFRAILDKATCVDPSQRFQSADEMLEDLENFNSGRQINCRRSSSMEKLWRWTRFNPALAAMNVVAAMLLLTVAITSLSAYWRIQNALESEKEIALKAVQTSQLAESSMDRIFERFAPNSIFSISENQTNHSLAQPVLSNEAATLLDDMLKYYLRLDMIGDTDEKLIGKSALAKCRVAEIYELIGNYEQAEVAYQSAIKTFTRLKNDDSNNLLIARARNHLGAIQRMLRNDEAWRQQHFFALELLEPLPPGEEVMLEMAQSYYLLGRAIRPGFSPNALPPPESSSVRNRRPPPRMGEILDKTQWSNLNIAMRILTDLDVWDEAYADRRQFLVGLCKRELAPDQLAVRTSQDREFENEAIEIFRGLTNRNPDNPSFRFELVQSLGEINVFFPAVDSEQLLAAQQKLEESIRHARLLVRDRPDVPMYESSLIHAHFKMAVILTQLDTLQKSDTRSALEHPLEKAAFHFRRAIQRQRLLIKHASLDIEGAQFQTYQIWLARFILTYLSSDSPRESGEFDDLFKLLNKIIVESSAVFDEEVDSPAISSSTRRSAARLIKTMRREMQNLEN